MPVSTTFQTPTSYSPVLISVESLSVIARTPTGVSQPVLKEVTLQVHKGELLALAGSSGSGKTTLLLALMGYFRSPMFKFGGKVAFNHPVKRSSINRPEQLWGSQIALVPQNAGSSLTPTKRVGEQIDENLKQHTGLNFQARRQRVIELLKQVNIPDPELYRRCYPHELSGGQQQRVTIAMAMASEPAVLLLDEPSSGLDQANIHELVILLKHIRQHSGMTIIVVSHDLDVIRTLADKVVVMSDGCLVEQGCVNELLTDDPEQQVAYPYSAELVRAFRPRLSARHSFDKTENLLECRQLSVCHKPAGISGWFKAGISILNDVSITLCRGETVVLTGASGSGKSTLLRGVAGIEELQDGTVQFAGSRLNGFNKRTLNDKRKIQLIFQNSDLALNPAFKVEEILRASLKLYFDMSAEQQDDEIEQLLRKVQLPLSYRQRYPAQLSGGERQRVAIARACAAKPELLLCDEITSALDVVCRNEILALLRLLAQEEQCGCLVVTHELEVMRQMADRIYVLDNGQVQGCYSFEDYKTDVIRNQIPVNVTAVRKEETLESPVGSTPAYVGAYSSVAAEI